MHRRGNVGNATVIRMTLTGQELFNWYFVIEQYNIEQYKTCQTVQRRTSPEKQ